MRTRELTQIKRTNKPVKDNYNVLHEVVWGCFVNEIESQEALLSHNL